MKKISLQLIATILSCFLLLVFFANQSFAYKNNDINKSKSEWNPSKLYIGTHGGYGQVSGADNNNGEVAFGRLAMGIHALDSNRFRFGAEFGVQSGNDMQLNKPLSVYEATAFMPVQATLKPFVDFLLTVTGRLHAHQPLFVILKGGIAYRQLQLVDRTSSEDNLRKVNAELQAGFGYGITPHATLTAFYQGIYAGGNAGVALDASGDVTISRIPTQQAGFLGIEYSL